MCGGANVGEICSTQMCAPHTYDPMINSCVRPHRDGREVDAGANRECLVTNTPLLYTLQYTLLALNTLRPASFNTRCAVCTRE